VSWDNPTYIVVFGPELFEEMEDQMVKIKKNLKEVRDRHIVYEDKNSNKII
jgi:hypothetical protein